MELNFDFENEEELERRIQEAKKIEKAKRQKRWEEEKRKRRNRNLAIGVACLVFALFVAIRGLGNEDAIEEIASRQKEEVLEIEAGKAAAGLAEKIEKIMKAYSFRETSDTVGICSEKVISTNAVLVNAGTDTITAKKDANTRISPASMTKVLTVLVAAEAITEEQLDDKMTITLEMTDYAYAHDCSTVGFLDGETVTVRDLLYGTILPSGGDAALGLATYVAGSHEAFVEKMNKKLEVLGIADSSHFTNSVGLYDKKHYSTVYDMAVIMKAAMENELCKEILTTRTYTTSSTAEHPDGITISNWFIRRIEDKDNESGGEVLGAKTGFVVQSKNCAVSYGIFGKEKTPYICVTAGATSGWQCIYDHVEIYTKYIK